MIEQKDHAREDLRTALNAWLQDHPGRSLAAGYLADGYLAGHGDGWNRCLDGCIKTIWDMRPVIDGGTEFLPGNEFSHAKWNALSEAIKELEKLRR